MKINLGMGCSITVEVDGRNGTVTSEGLREDCPYCGQPTCERSCDESQAGGFSVDDQEDQEERLITNAKISGIENLLLALACFGVAVDSSTFRIAIETALNTIGNEA